MIGTYHDWSEAHMHRYLAEFDFRYSTKGDTDAERAEQALRGIEASALPIGGMLRSQPEFYEAPRQIGEMRKRWTK